MGLYVVSAVSEDQTNQIPGYYSCIVEARYPLKNTEGKNNYPRVGTATLMPFSEKLLTHSIRLERLY